MPTWSYTAIPASGASTAPVQGELVAEDSPSVRAQLRRAGFEVLDLREHHPPLWTRLHAQAFTAPVAALVAERLRARRIAAKAEFFDAIATMIDAGLTLLDAVDSVGESRTRIGSLARVLAQDLRDGKSFGVAMADRDSWFDDAERAIVRAGEHRGDLAAALRTLSDRQHRSGELSGKLISALAYPAIVTVVGIGVVVFLSTKTLPEITQILIDADIDVPAITSVVMALGQGAVAFGPVILFAAPAVAVAALGLGRVPAARLVYERGRNVLVPSLVRRAAVGDAITELAELARVGVPLTDALRIVAETARGFGIAPLRHRLRETATHVEQGTAISAAFSDRRWFDGELQRLIATGESAGELPSVLERVGERYRRSARRAIDRLAAVLEPAVVLMLAAGIGFVVMAAIQPLVRLQEVL